MPTIDMIKNALPDWAKDIRLNLDNVLTRSSLSAADAAGAAVAAAYAAKSPALIDALRSLLSDTDAEAALTAAALMGMNNVWYPYVEMANDPSLKSLPAQLRMQAYASHGGVDKLRFELFALAASIVGKCHFCVASHYDLLKQGGFSLEQLRDVGRVAAVVQAASLALAAVRHEG